MTVQEWLAIECPDCGAGPSERCRPGCICEHPSWVTDREKAGMSAGAEEPRYDPNVPLGQLSDFGPPIGGVAPPLQCNRITHGDLAGKGYCGREATWHIIWTADIENGLACDEHAQEARELWVFYAIHEYEPACSMSNMGAMYFHDINRCLLPGERADLEAAAQQEVPADA